MTMDADAALAEARAKATEKAETLREYLEYVYRVSPKEAGVLTCSEDESPYEVRRNLALAAVVAGVPIASTVERKARRVTFSIAKRAPASRRKAE